MVRRSASPAAIAVLPLVLGLGGCAADPRVDRGHDEPAQHEELEGHDDHDDHGSEAGRIVLTPEAHAAAGIEVAPVERRAFEPVVRVTGTLGYDERRMAVATARVGGRVASVVADYGQRVDAGDVLAWIDSPELGAAQADFRRAWSMDRLHRAELERARLLLEGDAISRAELLRREADRRAAQAELETAEQRLHLLGLSQSDVEELAREDARADHVYPVRAAIDGRVTERRVAPGRVVAPDEALFTIADLRTLWLFLQVFEKDLPLVRRGARVELSCESHPEDRFSGTIDFVGEVLDPHSRTLPARAMIDNREGQLKPGMFVYARIAGVGPGEAALGVRASAVTRIDERDVVFVELAPREFEARAVRVAARSGEWVAIEDGLVEGERVAVAGTFALKSERLKGGLEGHHH